MANTEENLNFVKVVKPFNARRASGRKELPKTGLLSDLATSSPKARAFHRPNRDAAEVVNAGQSWETRHRAMCVSTLSDRKACESDE